MELIPVEIKKAIDEAAMMLKQALPQFEGNLQFNFSPKHPKPKVNILQADVTKEKK